MSLDVKKFIAGLHDYLSKALNPLHKRIEAIEQRLDTIEKSGVRYRGVFQRADNYQRGDLVTHGGGLWACVADKAGSVPGKSNDWQLAVKSGRATNEN